MIQTSRVSARWLLGAGQLAFATSFRFGKSGEHEVRVLVSREELARRARDLRENAEEDARFEAKIPRGRGVQIVTIRVPRELLLSLANAIAGAVSDEDAGHRLWHREYPHQPRPCHDCQETIDARRMPSLPIAGR